VEEDASNGKGTESELPTHQIQGSGTERPPPIKLTATVYLLKFQAEVKAVTNGSFEFHSTRNGIRMVTRNMADYIA